MKQARTYSDRLKVLLTLGRPESDIAAQPSDAESALDLTADDGPELLAMATDKQLCMGSEPACYAPVYAWRAIGRLRYTPAARPLVDALDWFARRNDEWALEEVPFVIAQLGPGSIVELKRILPDQRYNEWARTAAAGALSNIAVMNPEARAAVIDALVGQLALARYNAPYLNASVIGSLMDMRAVEAEGAIRRVFENGDADETLCGDVDEVMERLRSGTID